MSSVLPELLAKATIALSAVRGGQVALELQRLGQAVAGSRVCSVNGMTIPGSGKKRPRSQYLQPIWGKAIAMRTVCLTILALFCAACGGTIIKPMSPGAANAWHAENARLNDKEGYVFYAPQLVVTVQREILCLEPEAQGACAKTELRCGVSDPFVLPDFARPYTARFKRGFASSQSTVKFVDGWLLSEASSTTDNKALFDLIGAAAKFADGADGCKPGLYTVRPADPVTGAGFALTRIYQLPEP